MDKTLLAISCHTSPDAVVAIWNGRTIDQKTFLSHVKLISQSLPEGQFAINLCQDRYLFLVSFYAVLNQQQCNLLPPSNVSTVIADIASDYPSAYILSDDESMQSDYIIKASDLVSGVVESIEPVTVESSHTAAVVFTSGSTGKPKPNIKTWGALCEEARLAKRRFGFGGIGKQAVVATVPAQHMYGLATSIVIPMRSASIIVCGPTFYPADINNTIESTGLDCVLVSTPIHLKACAESALSWKNINAVISATAMMPIELAHKIEKKLKTKLYEIYGASEFGSIASRRTVSEPVWHLYDDMQVESDEKSSYIRGPQLKSEVELQDVIEILDAGHFMLKSRNSDLVKIAGKRISLGELNQKLSEIDGIVDGVFYVPNKDEVNQRLIAFVVAPTLSKQKILAELKQSIDSAFLPRPLILVDELPRNATGKLPHHELLNLLNQELLAS